MSASPSPLAKGATTSCGVRGLFKGPPFRFHANLAECKMATSALRQVPDDQLVKVGKSAALTLAKVITWTRKVSKIMALLGYLLHTILYRTILYHNIFYTILGSLCV